MATTKIGIYKDKRLKKCWVVRWLGTPDPDTGAVRRPGKGFRRRRDAEHFAALKQAEFDAGARRDPPKKITLEEYCEKYIRIRSPEWAEKTLRLIHNLRDRLINHFGTHTLLRDITPELAHAFWSSQRCVRAGREGQPLSRDAFNRILRDATAMFRCAVVWGDLLANPFAGIRQLRVGKRDRRDWRLVSPAEYLRILKTAPTLRWRCFYALAFCTGCRVGELLNLTWDDICLQTGRVFVRNKAGSAVLFPFRVKDHESREMPIPEHARRLLAGWLRIRRDETPYVLLTDERYRRVLVRWHGHRRVGKPWLPDYLANNLNRDVRRHALAAGLENLQNFSIHCFRKSAATNWARNLPIHTVKELLGHSNISTTEAFYTKVSSDERRQAQRVIEELTVGQARADRRGDSECERDRRSVERQGRRQRLSLAV